MNIAHVLNLAQKAHLRPEMEVFLAYLLEMSRLDLIAHAEKEIPVEKLADLQKGWTRIQDGVPVTYLTHNKEFYGLDLFVDERVLVPRAETEMLVDYVLEKAKGMKGKVRVLELGTGSGAIAVALKKTKPELEVVATDVSEEALKVANKNIVQYDLEIELIQSDLLESVPDEKFDILVANLPYIGTEENNFISENVEKHEPNVALFGGDDGLRLYAKLFEQITEQNRDFAYIMGELGFTQGGKMKDLAAKLLPDYEVEIRQDYQELDRHFILKKK